MRDETPEQTLQRAREELEQADRWLREGSLGPALGAATHGARLAGDIHTVEGRRVHEQCEALAHKANAAIERTENERKAQPALPLAA